MAKWKKWSHIFSWPRHTYIENQPTSAAVELKPYDKVTGLQSVPTLNKKGLIFVPLFYLASVQHDIQTHIHLYHKNNPSSFVIKRNRLPIR